MIKSYIFKPVWNTTYSIIVILFCIFLFIFFELSFGKLMKSFIWLFPGILVVIFFLICLNYTVHNWLALPARRFLRTLFAWSLILRFLTMVVLYFVFKHLTGTHFSIGGGDEYAYHTTSIYLANQWRQGNFGIMKYIPFGFTYSGYPTFCATLYFLLGYSTILARIANCIIGSLSVLLTYKIARDLWGECIGRTAGIIALLFPLMVFYSGVQLKDTILTFLVLLVTYNVLKWGSGKKTKFWQLVLVIGAVVSIFTFRTVVGIITISCILIYSVIPKSKSLYSNMRKVAAGIAVILLSLLLLLGMSGNKPTLNRLVRGYGLAEYRAAQWGTSGSDISGYASFNLFSVIAFPAPFPTLVDIPLDTTSAPVRGEYYHIGTMLVWNILSFFSLIGIFSAIKKRFHSSLLLWLFTLFYLLTLAQSNFIMHERFRLVIAPFLIIFTAVGLYKASRGKMWWWIIYLLGNAILIFGWNYYRLAGRGMI